MTALEPGEISVIEDAAAGAGASYRDDYSGRGMSGRTCIGLDGTMAEITKALVLIGLANPGLAERMTAGMRTDSMGIDFIAYWPYLTVEGTP